MGVSNASSVPGSRQTATEKSAGAANPRVGAHCCHSEIALLRGERLRYFQRSRDPLRPTSKPRQARGFFYHGGILLPSRRAAQVREDCQSTEAAPFQEAGGSNSLLTGDASVW